MTSLVWQMLRDSAERFPDKEALVCGDHRLCYREVYSRVLRIANGLRNAGVRRGDRVGIYLEPSVEQVIGIFAASQADAAFVPINSQLFPEQALHIVRDCGMKAIITTTGRFQSLVEGSAPLPALQSAILVDEGDNPAFSGTIHQWQSFLDSSTGDKEVETATISKDLGAILYTSGSTGKPKGVMLSHANVVAGSAIVSDYLGITSEERILAVLPFSFDAGLNQVMTAFQQGATIVVTTFSFARDIIRLLIKERITGLAGVPTVWALLTQPTSSLDKQPLPHLRYITNTGGAMPQSVLAILRRLLPTTQIFLMYGLTEAFRSTYLPPSELDRRPTSMGKAIPDTEILIINENGQLCGPGEIGELVHRGPTVSMGYWGRPEDTNHALRPNPLLPPELGDCERVCYSGDLVKKDEDGFIYFVGRRDTMIKSSGFRISPTEVEEVLYRSGKVREAAVIGIPDEVLGQAVKAFVTARDGLTVDADEVLAYCSQQIPRYMIPKTVEVLDRMPKTTSGKVDYPNLRKREI